MIKEIKDICIKLKPLINGNWCNDSMGQLEELESKVDKIGDLLLFIIAEAIYDNKTNIEILKEQLPDGWKIDYK